jgi:amino acid adenylation domain-containing protein
MATILGVLRAGAAFVPVDHRLTSRRVGTILAVARVDLFVTDAVHAGSVAAWPAVDPAELRAAPGPELPVPAPGDTAYVMFTSGSTGTPKGVVIAHRALARYLDWAVATYLRFGVGGAPLYSSIAFDLTVTSMFAPLAAGRTVHLVPAEDGVFGVADLLAAGVSFDFVKLTPSHLRMLLAELTELPATGRVASLVLGGEALPPDLVHDWRKIDSKTVIVNEYGPTEATVGCCVLELGAAEPVPDEIPIGRAIPAVAFRVLDEHGIPAPVGATGELYIGGDTLADGYFGRPGQTAERFLPDPYGAGSGGRLYRTGDVVRMRADGQLCYLGRNDDQVKIRGHRVELGEIAAALRAHPDVLDCVATVWRRDAYDLRLVAYVVRRTGAPRRLAAALVRYLTDRLPDYMVPRHVVEIDRVPHTINGKVDRARLPEPTAPR